MVVHSTSQTPSFSPAAAPHIAVAGDGTLVAIAEPTRIVIIELSSGQPVSEIGVDLTAGATESAWVGATPRLLVLSRFAAHSTVHLIDPRGAAGPRSLAEIRLESPMRLFASVGAHALAVGSLGAAVLTTGDAHLTPFQFPARGVPVAAGAAGVQFVVALQGSVEEWDPASRMPKRRFRLPQPTTITHVGGSERVVWMTTRDHPTRIDVIPLVNRGQPKAHELPEPIAAVSGHPKSDVVACIGADTGRLYVIDLDGRARIRTIATEGIDRVEAVGLVVGRMVGVVAAQAERPLAIIALDSRETEPVALLSNPSADDHVSKKSTLTDDEPEASRPVVPAAIAPIAVAPPVAVPAAIAPIAVAPPVAVPVAIAPIAVAPPVAAPVIAPVAPAAAPVVAPQVAAAPATAAPPKSVFSPAARVAPERPSWRDPVVTWAAGVVGGSFDRSAPPAPPIEELAGRFALAAQLVPALVLMYGAHLAGTHGAAPADLARVLGRRWDEALGRGQLAALGLVHHERSRVILAPAIVRALDELPPATGTLVGEPGTVALLGPCVVVAGDPLPAIAARYLAAVGGAILAAHPGADPAELVLEARARGAAPMLRVAGKLDVSGPAIFVVAADALADALGVPRL